MSEINISLSRSRLSVDTLGARKTLALNGTLVLTQVTRGDGKVGSTHPCTPIFGPDRNNLFGLNQHGDTRNQSVEIQKISDSQLEIKHEINDIGYPQRLWLTQIISLSENSYSLEMIHTNKGSENVPVNSGEHCYFNAPKGYTGAQLNRQDLTKIIESHKDGVPIKLKPSNLIEIPGVPPLILEQTGFEYAMIWVGSSPDLTTKDQDYICIEPVENNPESDYFGSTHSLLAPNQIRKALFSLTIKAQEK